MATLVEIGRFRSLPEAAVAKSCLEAYGHPVMAMEHYHASVAWHHLFAIGGVRLVAPEPEAAQARLLLDTLARDSSVAASARGVGPVSPGFAKRCLAVLLLFMLYVIVPPQVMKRRPAL